MDIFKKFGKRKHRFRDPIYGFIELNDSELKIIDTPIFQRLRRIHQLALTKYVYPSAEHSRFTHSIGVLNVATEIFLNIYANSDPALLSKNTEDQLSDIANKLQILRFATLLHDIGHLPFSHAAENLILEGKASHERLGQYIIKNYPPIRQAIEERDIDPQIVAMLLDDKPLGEYFILKNIVSGQLDADRADYLLRDSYVCGVKYGEYDYKRYIQSFFLRENQYGLPQLCIEEKNVYLVESFLMARYHYNLQVPYHRTRSGYDITLKKYIEFLKDEDRFPEFIKFDKNDKIKSMDFDQFEIFDDYSIFELIKADYIKGGNIWAKMLMRQEHLVPVFDHIKAADGDNMHEYKGILKGLADELEENKDFFRYKKVLKVSKLLQKTDMVSDQYPLGLIVNDKPEPENILDYSNILNQLVKPIEIFRIYTLKRHQEKALELSRKTFEFFKELKDV
nr:HD domain-containing protein [uncultured Desulfobacter sp.]